jgi:hypothetical protein
MRSNFYFSIVEVALWGGMIFMHPILDKIGFRKVVTATA